MISYLLNNGFLSLISWRTTTSDIHNVSNDSSKQKQIKFLINSEINSLYFLHITLLLMFLIFVYKIENSKSVPQMTPVQRLFVVYVKHTAVTSFNTYIVSIMLVCGM